MILSSPSVLKTTPKRIVSLVPSQTELLAHLGLDAETIGITKFCVHPAGWRNTKEVIGGTKNIRLEKIKALHPDLVLANKEENTREQVEELANFFPVWVTDVNDLDGAVSMMRDVGELTGTLEKAARLAEEIELSFQHLEQPENKINTAYLIWKDPYMTVGGDTFIHDMMKRCGFNNVFQDHLRYPSLQLEELIEKQCQLLLLSSEPYPFKTHHLQALQNELPQLKITLVDGEYFSWYGSRLLSAPSYFNDLVRSLHT